MTHRQMTRRHLLQAAGAAALAAPVARPVAAQGETTITAIMSVGGSGKAFQGGLELFNERFAGQYRLETEMVAFETLREKEISQFISGNATYDVLSINSDWLSGVAHFLEPLDSYIERDGLDLEATFGSAIAKTASVSGQVVGMPTRTGGDVYWYNKDMFDEAGLEPPRTLDELRKNAQTVQKQSSSGETEVYGYSIMAASPLWTVSSFADLYYPHGGHYLTVDLTEANPSLLEPFTAEILDFMKGLATDGLTPDPLAWTYDDNIVAFQQARLASSAEGWMRSNLMEDLTKSKVVGKIGYDVMPSEKLGPDEPTYYGASGWGLCIDKNSPRKDAAWELLKFMVGYDAQKLMAMEYANGPTVLAVLEDPEFQEEIPAAAAYLKGAKVGLRSHFPVAQQAELEQVTHEELQSFLVGNKDSKTTAEDLYRQIDDLLQA